MWDLKGQWIDLEIAKQNTNDANSNAEVGKLSCLPGMALESRYKKWSNWSLYMVIHLHQLYYITANPASCNWNLKHFAEHNGSMSSLLQCQNWTDKNLIVGCNLKVIMSFLLRHFNNLWAVLEVAGPPWALWTLQNKGVNFYKGLFLNTL